MIAAAFFLTANIVTIGYVSIPFAPRGGRASTVIFANAVQCEREETSIRAIWSRLSQFDNVGHVVMPERDAMLNPRRATDF